MLLPKHNYRIIKLQIKIENKLQKSSKYYRCLTELQIRVCQARVVNRFVLEQIEQLKTYKAEVTPYRFIIHGVATNTKHKHSN